MRLSRSPRIATEGLPRTLHHSVLCLPDAVVHNRTCMWLSDLQILYTFRRPCNRWLQSGRQRGILKRPRADQTKRKLSSGRERRRQRHTAGEDGPQRAHCSSWSQSTSSMTIEPDHESPSEDLNSSDHVSAANKTSSTSQPKRQRSCASVSGKQSGSDVRMGTGYFLPRSDWPAILTLTDADLGVDWRKKLLDCGA